MVTSEQYVRRIGADSVYVFRAGAVGLLAFVLLVTGFATGAGLVVVGAGVPVIAATLAAARRFAADERHRVGAVLGRRLTEPQYRRAAPGGSVARRLLVVLADRRSWRDAAHGLLRVVPGVAGFCLVVTWFAGALAGLTAPLWSALSPDGVQTIGGLLFGGDRLLMVLTDVAIGAVFVATLPPLVHAVAVTQARFSRALLRPVREGGQ